MRMRREAAADAAANAAVKTEEARVKVEAEAAAEEEAETAGWGGGGRVVYLDLGAVLRLGGEQVLREQQLAPCLLQAVAELEQLALLLRRGSITFYQTSSTAASSG